MKFRLWGTAQLVSILELWRAHPGVKLTGGVCLILAGPAYAMTQQPASKNPVSWLSWVFVVLMGVLLAAFAVEIWLLKRRRKQQETKLEQVREAEAEAREASRAKTLFMGHVSHELRTPLNAIIGYSELIAEDLESISEPKLRNKIRGDLDIIKSSAYYQLALINNLLDLTELETNKAKLLLQEFDIQDLIRQVTEQMQVMFSIHQNSLEIFYNPSPPGRMKADLRKLEGILVNILSNANKFTSEGMIWLTVRILKEDEKEFVDFAIRDNGQGIKTDHMRTLFHEYSQMVDHTQLGGVGLGLKVCKRFCQMMGGTISVQSTFGEGSTFTVRVPRFVPETQDSFMSREFPVLRPRRVSESHAKGKSGPSKI